MAKIAFIGLGNMGGPMAANLVKAQHQVTAFDLSDSAVAAAVEKGARKAASTAEAVKDAPVSGGVGGAIAGTLTFMVGGPDEAFAKARPILQQMGKNIVHTGTSG